MVGYKTTLLLVWSVSFLNMCPTTRNPDWPSCKGSSHAHGLLPKEQHPVEDIIGKLILFRYYADLMTRY